MDGEEIKLAEFRGRALLIVNVASKCGSTPQYEGLQTLHERYAEQGLQRVGPQQAHLHTVLVEERRAARRLDVGVGNPSFGLTALAVGNEIAGEIRIAGL